MRQKVSTLRRHVVLSGESSFAAPQPQGTSVAACVRGQMGGVVDSSIVTRVFVRTSVAGLLLCAAAATAHASPLCGVPPVSGAAATSSERAWLACATDAFSREIDGPWNAVLNIPRFGTGAPPAGLEYALDAPTLLLSYIGTESADADADPTNPRRLTADDTDPFALVASEWSFRHRPESMPRGSMASAPIGGSYAASACADASCSTLQAFVSLDARNEYTALPSSGGSSSVPSFTASPGRAPGPASIGGCTGPLGCNPVSFATPSAPYANGPGSSGDLVYVGSGALGGPVYVSYTYSLLAFVPPPPPTPVPEPATCLLLGVGLVAVRATARVARRSTRVQRLPR